MKTDKIKKEMIDVGYITLYFFICFAIFMIIKKLVLFQHHTTFYGWSSAFIGALAIGKVVVIIDKSPVQKWLSYLKPYQEILLKAGAYSFLVFIVSIIEKTIHFWIEAPLLGNWQSHLFGHGNAAMLLAHFIYIYFCFIGFFFIHFLVEMFGRDKFIAILTTKR